ncbi:hypothetical protein ACNJYD_21865 [Bradyrhizobium sp. DASA03005]|uniref:hypothetical protein n=1 Tax=Bradyrhizobium TaxID=374 RepID=UPI00155F37DA|nr:MULTISPECIES: hypothetical protein [Bradyrhizobium]MBR1169308.1 hypothetical protein [Bradyrhizobium liaoningense]MDA9501334.1 hypothetical protein [Bradyrhizobium sp. CCBAU 11357]MDD1521189.1 hypothetical protein [Bradyrhizobium sp. WBAH30]MDD1544757.1 hypothetical protein [Bradyrhizobium sp. WBAH41]MDD1556769.1 hypothetical protein [Bradyrhizobium sp. WBAH23]
MFKLSFAATAFVVAFSGATAQSAETRGACKADYDKFCAGIAPGGGIVACLNAKRDQLSATCKTALDSRKKK